MTTLLTIADYSGLESPAGDRQLALDRGEMLVVRGDSGAGKTRFLRRLIDLDPEPRGKITLDGTAVDSIPAAELRRRLGYVPQDPVRFPMTGRELLEHVRSLRGNVEQCAPWGEVTALLARLEVGKLLDRPMSEYSGGENRRFALVAVLQLRPEVLLLDEPTAGLDARRTAEVVALIEQQLAARLAVLWVTHELPGALLCRQQARVFEA